MIFSETNKNLRFVFLHVEIVTELNIFPFVFFCALILTQQAVQKLAH